MDKFIELVKRADTINCIRWNILDGEGLYHSLGVFDDRVIVLKKYSYRKKAWLYYVEYIYLLRLFVEQHEGWIIINERKEQ